MEHHRLGRYELLHSWQKLGQRLEAQGECSRHLRSFTQRVEALPGEDVAEIVFQWNLLQAHRRQTQTFWLVLASLLAGLCGLALLGKLGASLLVLAVGALGTAHLAIEWKHEDSFASEIDMRARYLVNSPAF